MITWLSHLGPRIFITVRSRWYDNCYQPNFHHLSTGPTTRTSQVVHANQIHHRCFALYLTSCKMKRKKHLYATHFLLLIDDTIKVLRSSRDRVHGHCRCDSDQQRWFLFQSRVFEWFYARDSDSRLVVVSVISTVCSRVRHVFSRCYKYVLVCRWIGATSRPRPAIRPRCTTRSRP